MKIIFIRETNLLHLKTNISGNLASYTENSSWLDNYFANMSYHFEGTLTFNDFKLLPSVNSKHFDLENTKALFLSMKDLPISLANDERFWSYLTHVTFWEYMRTRWPLQKMNKTEDSNPVNYIQSRYFFMNDQGRALFRNGLSRLWWYGYLTYDMTRDNPFELTEVLLSDLDIALNLTERSFPRNPIMFRTILSVMSDLNKQGEKISNRRNKVRGLLAHLNKMGGVTVLDTLTAEEIEKITLEKLSS